MDLSDGAASQPAESNPGNDSGLWAGDPGPRPGRDSSMIYAQLDARLMGKMELIVGIYDDVQATLVDGRSGPTTKAVTEMLVGPHDARFFVSSGDFPGGWLRTKSREEVRVLPADTNGTSAGLLPVSLKEPGWKIQIQAESPPPKPPAVGRPGPRERGAPHTWYQDTIQRVDVGAALDTEAPHVWQLDRNVRLHESIPMTQDSTDTRSLVLTKLQEAFPGLSTSPNYDSTENVWEIDISQHRLLLPEELMHLEKKRLDLRRAEPATPLTPADQVEAAAEHSVFSSNEPISVAMRERRVEGNQITFVSTEIGVLSPDNEAHAELFEILGQIGGVRAEIDS